VFHAGTVRRIDIQTDLARLSSGRHVETRKLLMLR
jgi:hypothetical protein